MQALQLEEVAVKVLRRPVRHLYLRVQRDGSVHLSVPWWISASHIDGFVRGRLEWIRRAQQRVRAKLVRDAEHPTHSAQWCREQLQAMLPDLLACWEPRIGRAASRVSFRRMRSRWGSCNPRTGVITLNSELAHWPARCVEYVLVHELVHLLEPSHNARFKRFMDALLPDWRAQRARLRSAPTP